MRARLGSALLALGSLAGTLGLVEAGLRMRRHFQGGGKEAGEIGVYHRYDPLLGWSKTPGA